MTEILDFIVIFLLVVAIIYGIILNKKIVLIQNSKEELANLFKSFDDTILRAQIGIDELKSVSSDISISLQEKMDKASILADDLAFLSEKSVEVSTQIDKKIKEARRSTSGVPRQARQPSSGIKTPGPDEIKKMRAQSQAVKNDNKTSTLPIKAKSPQDKSKVLEGLLERISESKQVKSANNDGKSSKPAFGKMDVNSPADEDKIVADMLKAMGYGES